MIKEIKLIRLLKIAYSFSATLLIFIFDTCVITFVRKSAHQSEVAIIRLDSIGDFILWLDAAKEFRNLYPNKKITLIANQAWFSLAALLPYWDEIIPVDRQKFIRAPIYRLKTLRRIRLRGIETAIQTAYSREFRLDDSLIRASGALYRIGSIGDLSNITAWEKIISDIWYTKLIPATAKPLMELQRNTEFMRRLGIRNFVASVPLLPKLIDLPANLTIEQPYFIIFPGASLSEKMWPAKKFAELLSKLTESHEGCAVLCGTREEQALCARIIDASGLKAINLAGETSLPELVEVIRRAEILVGNDTSAVHIAAAVGTPSVCISGGGHFGRFIPYVAKGDPVAPVPVFHQMDCFGCNWQCTQPHERGNAMPCISRISVHEVLMAVESVIATSKTKWDANISIYQEHKR